MLAPLGKAFLFRGRSRRSETWLAMFFWTLLSGLAANLERSLSGRDVSLDLPSVLLFAAPYLLFGFPLLPLMARRVQDIGRFGWLGVLFMLIVTPLGIWQKIHHHSQAVPRLPWSIEVIGGGLLVILGYTILLHPGEKGPNRYGPDPRASE